TGSLTQGPNIGASNATVTGTLTFQGYPCLTTASVNGQISGNAVILQLIGTNGLNVGQIGAPIGYSKPSPVNVVTSAIGTVLQGAFGYGITTSACPGGNLAGDLGDVCIAIGSSNGCTQPITLSPPTLAFLPQLVGSAPTAQTIMLTNSAVSGTALTGLSISFNPQSGLTSPFGASDFNEVPNFTEQDNCATSPGGTFSLAPLQSCSITISFSPQQSCPWLPSVSLGGVAPSSCPYPLKAIVTVNTQVSADSLTAFAVPITGSGLSAIVPTTPEVDFGSEALGESSAPQTFSFMNQGNTPVQILPALNTPCVNPTTGVLTLVRPPFPGLIGGLQVDTNAIVRNGNTINYSCDSDLTSQKPNFQISGDNCSGTLLGPQSSCSVQIMFVPQPNTSLASGLDYFLELNTQQCNSTTTVDCEIDSGRFPVELTANVASPLRMTPGAGLDFGLQTRGTASAPLTITIFNDPKDPHAGIVNFTGNSVKGDFLETDNCLGSLAPGASCTMNVTFQPRVVGFDQGTITVTYAVQQTQIIHLRGIGQ
ncbi:MAG TPA: choice-of-anchor D domain-containing protein, partial [Candidatus Eisenbacteria bacterium]|nr:choice-of-anchor D domain-containing protein [Candidatus Eisenbacteria bacterium]